MESSVVTCICPECGRDIEFKTKPMEESIKKYDPGDHIPIRVLQSLIEKDVICECGCFCELEALEHKYYSVSIR